MHEKRKTFWVGLLNNLLGNFLHKRKTRRCAPLNFQNWLKVLAFFGGGRGYDNKDI